jgi:polysaccharide transporter, PST family
MNRIQDFRNRIIERTGLIIILKNSGWLLADRVIRMGIGLLVTIKVARYLGPSAFGLMNYALAFTSLFAVICTLGLDSIVVRDLLKKTHKTEDLMGTSFYLRVIATLLTILLILVIIFFVDPKPELTQTLIIILSSAFVFPTFDTIDYYFQAKLLSKFTVIAKNIAFIVAALIKFGLVYFNSSLIYFAWANFIELAIGAILLVLVYRINNFRITDWKFNKSLSLQLMKNGWPLLLSGIVVLVYMKIDQIMIGDLLNDKEVGIYSAAVRISEIWYFIPGIITISVFPSVIKMKEENQLNYRLRMRKLYSLMAVLSITIAIIVTFLSHSIIFFLYGSEYLASSQILLVHIWSGVFVFLGVASSQYLVAENFTKIIFQRTFAGALINVLLNFYLIPRYGGLGAAYSTLIAYFVATFSIIFYKKSREQAYLMLTSFYPKNILKIFRN